MVVDRVAVLRERASERAADLWRSPWNAVRAQLQPAGTATGTSLLLAAAGGALLLVGLVMTFSASYVQSAAQTGDPFGIFTQQLLMCLLGLPAALVAATADYRCWRRFAFPLLTLALLASALVLVPGLGILRSGARRWLDLGPLTFQPSELLKLAIPLALAHLIAQRWPRVRAGDVHALLMPALPLLAVAAALVLAGPDLETAALVAAVGGTVLYVAGLPWTVIGAGTAALGLVGVVAIAQAGFRQGRIIAWLNPASDPSHFGYQTIQGYIALASGGLFGQGLGQSRAKWLYLPNPHTDFVYAVIGEEFGLVGALAVLLLFVALAVGGIRAAKAAPDPFGRLLAASLTSWLLLQAAINIGSVVGLLPVTGVTLPLVSYGGSSLLVTMVAVGLLVAIARAGSPPARAKAKGRR